MFSPARVELMRECRSHKKLMAKLARYKQEEWTEILGEIAAHCNIIIDGTYLPRELDNMCDILYNELRGKRKIIIRG